MTIPPLSAGIDAVFSSFDSSLLTSLHRLAVETQGFPTQAFRLWGLATDNGAVFLLAGAGLLLSRNTRNLGGRLLGSVGLAGVLAYGVKVLTARPRPFLLPGYQPWWQSLGIPVESGYAFPSGHVSTIMAAATVLFLSFDKKWSWVFFLPVLLSGVSRCYLMVHYPSDILGGVLIGFLAALVAVRALRRPEAAR